MSKTHAMFIAVVIVFCGCVQVTAQVPAVTPSPIRGRERGMIEAEVRTIVAAHTEGRQFGFLGEPRVNVVELNLDLDRIQPMKQ